MNKDLFFETPKDKIKVFQKPKLIMLSEGYKVESWNNTQPLYFYPFSWLDYLGEKSIRELHIFNCSQRFVKKNIVSLNNGKIYFEHLNKKLIKFAKEYGHKVSVICNLEELSPEQIKWLSYSDFVKVRVNKNYNNIYLLSDLPNEHILTCIKAYVGENIDYKNLAMQTKEIGFDFFHISKRLERGWNSNISDEEKQKIKELKELETEQFKIIIPSNLENKFAKKFLISQDLKNVSSCDFSKYRLVLNGDNCYPCYTQRIISQQESNNMKKYSANCLDCACIYENDMLHDIETKMRKYKNPKFALEYIENGK